jgi:phosphate transport system protein
MLRTRQAFDEQLDQLQQRLLQFGTFVEAMVDKAIRALTYQDLKLAREVIEADDTADLMDVEIEQMCMHLIAQQQPMASDLRVIGSTMKVIADVERIGDYAVDVAKIAVDLADTEYFKPLVDIPRMAELVRHMLRLGLEALVKRDVAMTQEIIEMDDEVDTLWRKLRVQLEDLMQERPSLVPQAVHLLLVARYLERIGDHIENIAERVVYVETGEIVSLSPRHTSERSSNPARNGSSPPA